VNLKACVPKFGRKVRHLRCDMHTSFKIKGRVTRPINADTHRAPYLPNGKAYELKTCCTDAGRRPASATGAMTSKVKGRGHVISLSRLGPMLYLVIRGGRGIPCRPNPIATLLINFISQTDDIQDVSTRTIGGEVAF